MCEAWVEDFSCQYLGCKRRQLLSLELDQRLQEVMAENGGWAEYSSTQSSIANALRSSPQNLQRKTLTHESPPFEAGDRTSTFTIGSGHVLRECPRTYTISSILCAI